MSIYLPTEVYVGLKAAKDAGLDLKDKVRVMNWLEFKGFNDTIQWISLNKTWYNHITVEGFKERIKEK